MLSSSCFVVRSFIVRSFIVRRRSSSLWGREFIVQQKLLSSSSFVGSSFIVRRRSSSLWGREFIVQQKLLSSSSSFVAVIVVVRRCFGVVVRRSSFVVLRSAVVGRRSLFCYCYCCRCSRFVCLPFGNSWCRVAARRWPLSPLRRKCRTSFIFLCFSFYVRINFVLGSLWTCTKRSCIVVCGLEEVRNVN